MKASRRSSTSVPTATPGAMGKRSSSAMQFQPAQQTQQFGQGEVANSDDAGNSLSLHAKISYLEKDVERRQESYISRERAYKVRIDELEEELTSHKQMKTGWMNSDTKISKLKEMQNKILNNVELVQDRTARIMQEQERDLLRAFRARLFDVQTELEKEKSKKDDGAAAWIEKSRQLESEVEWAKEVADRLERVNQSLLQENARLKSQFSSQEEDRNFLIKQLVSVKKDNAKLRAEYNEIELEREELLKSQPEPDDIGMMMMKGSGNVVEAKIAESEEKFKEVNVRLRRLLAEERKNLQQVRQNYANELRSRTEMEMLLRNCVEDVRKEIARRHLETTQFNNAGAGNNADLAKLYLNKNAQGNAAVRPVDEFTQEDRERALELLLSQERVISLIYAKTFPVSASSNVKISAGASNFDPVLNQGAASMNALLVGADEVASNTKLPSLGGGAQRNSSR